MIFSIIGLILGIIIPSLWIFIPLKKSSSEGKLSVWVYIRSIILGATICSLCIIIPEVLFDKFTGIKTHSVKNIWEAFASSFLCAALIEETVKFLFVRHVIRKHKPSDKLQYMLLAGTIGMGYGIIEKLGYGSAAVLLNAFFALHIMFQFVMGAYLYEAEKADDLRVRRNMTLKAFFVPFVIHGLWDFILEIAGLYINSDSNVVFWLIFILLIFLLISAVVMEVKMARRLK